MVQLTLPQNSQIRGGKIAAISAAPLRGATVVDRR